MNRTVQTLDNHRAQRNIQLFRSSRFILSVVCLLCSGEPGCRAQQSQAVQVPAPNDTKAFQQLENRWSEATGQRDQYALELVLAPELVDISETGDVTTRNQQIAMLLKKGGEALSLDQRVLSVRIFDNVAVVVGAYSELRRIHGKPIIGTGVFTHVYHLARGNWLCINAQRTAITEGAVQKKHGENSK